VGVRRRRRGRKRAQQGIEVVAEVHNQAARALEVAGDCRDRSTWRQHEKKGNGKECERVRRGKDSGKELTPASRAEWAGLLGQVGQV
jgi:hypothetical protein